MHTNPYIAGNPVGGGDAFVGRSKVMDDVLRVLNDPRQQGIVLYGQRRIGKTSILLQLQAALAAEEGYVPIYFDLQDKAAKPLEDVLRELSNRLLYALDLPEWTPETENFSDTFEGEFLPYALSQIPDKRLVLLFDEFDVMDVGRNQAGNAFFPFLRSVMGLNPERLKFVFVIGRRPEDLSNLTLSVFKNIKSGHVSLMSLEESAELLKLSEKNQSLSWPKDALAEVFALSGGHPFLTQQLAYMVWEALYDDDPEEAPEVSLEDIRQAIPETLSASTNALQWLWDGLGPAERVVASALAEAGKGIITQEGLEKCLQESGVRILICELRNAPQILEEWDLIRRDDGGYRMPTEMLRRWIVANKPLSRVQDEIDRIEPLANNLFQSAYGLYQREHFQDAVPLLRQALSFNPNHLKANLLLAEILLVEGEVDKALRILEALYAYHPAAARPRLIQTLLAKAQSTEDEQERITLYERILELDSEQPEALAACRRFWEKEGNQAYEREDFKQAVEAYSKARISSKIKEAEAQLEIDELYTRALKALEEQDTKQAQKLLARVLTLRAEFREAARYMYLAVTGVDPVLRIEELETRIQELEKPFVEIGLDESEDSYKLAAADDPFQAFSLENFEFEAVEVNERAKKVRRKQCQVRQFIEDLGNGITLEMVAIPGGTFLMGSSENEKGRETSEGPQHEVTIAPFFMGRFPVTQEQWQAVLSENPSNFKGAKCPVEMIKWEDAMAFCEKLSKQSGRSYRLPTETEWEYACRAGTGTPFCFGPTISGNLANYRAIEAYASEKVGMYREETSDVGIFTPNPFGLYDMHGNVWEWCADPWHKNYEGAPTDGSVWEEDGDTSFRLLRGGSWDVHPFDCRSARRYRFNHRSHSVGVRVFCSVS